MIVILTTISIVFIIAGLFLFYRGLQLLKNLWTMFYGFFYLTLGVAAVVSSINILIKLFV